MNVPDLLDMSGGGYGPAPPASEKAANLNLNVPILQTYMTSNSWIPKFAVNSIHCICRLSKNTEWIKRFEK